MQSTSEFATMNFSTREEIQGYLNQLSRERGLIISDNRFAALLDARDPLASLRSNYLFPTNAQFLEGKPVPEDIDPNKEILYFTGNSLGLQPKTARALVNAELDKWQHKAIAGHFEGEYPWYYMEQFVIEESARIVGAKPVEVTIMNSLTVNIHLAMAAFYRPTKERYKVLIEQSAFPSDHFAIESQIRWHGYQPETSMVLMPPREGESIWRNDDVLKLIEEEGDSIAFIWLPGVHYVTGQFFDMKSIAEMAHKKGCLVGFDLAHAAGNVEMFLHDWEVDVATWCCYKYLNAGPGAIGGFFVHEKHGNKEELTRLLGWWSHEIETRMDMKTVCKLGPGAASFQVSNPPILMISCLQASLEIFKQTSMKELCQKSRLLTGYLELLLEENGVKIITSKDPQQRGSHLALTFSKPAKPIHEYLRSKAVAADVRGEIMRVAPVSQYTSYSDVLQFTKVLKEAIKNT